MLGVIGDVVQDVIVWQLEETREATDIKSEVRMRRGGSAANVAAFAAPRYPTRFIGCVGDWWVHRWILSIRWLPSGRICAPPAL